MTQELMDAVERASQVLGQENAALHALDFHVVGTLIVEKRLAIEALQSLDAAGAKHLPSPKGPELRAAALRLQILAQDNKRLLERAITVQTRIMGVIARAVRVTQAPPGYGGHGQVRSRRVAGAMALVVRA